MGPRKLAAQRLFVSPYRTVKFLFGRPAPVYSPGKPDAAIEDGSTPLDYPSHTFGKEETKGIRAAARAVGV